MSELEEKSVRSRVDDKACDEDEDNLARPVANGPSFTFLNSSFPTILPSNTTTRVLHARIHKLAAPMDPRWDVG